MWQQRNPLCTIATELLVYPNVAIKSLKKVILNEDLLKKVNLEEEFLELQETHCKHFLKLRQKCSLALHQLTNINAVCKLRYFILLD